MTVTLSVLLTRELEYGQLEVRQQQQQQQHQDRLHQHLSLLDLSKRSATR